MLTRRGWLLAGTTLASLTAGRLLGLVELFVVAAATGGLLLLSASVVAMSRLRLEVARSVHPPRVFAGSPSRVDLYLCNRARTRTPVLRLEDPVSGTRGAHLLLGPLPAGARAEAAYRLPTERRGILEVGPLRVSVSDPLGLAEAHVEGAAPTELTVYPPIERISPPPHTSGDDPHAGAEHPNALGRSGEDFYALRAYVVGDDLRRVHWRSTAHHGELMVRQDELPWQGRATILLDVRRAATTPDSLELAVSAAASIAHACWRRQDLVRLVSTDGTDSGFAAGNAQMEAIMEHLAVVPAVEMGAFRRTLERLSRGGTGGSLVAVVSNLRDDELEALLRLRGRFGWSLVVKFEPSSWDPSAELEGVRSTRQVLRVTRRRPFAAGWEAAVAARRPQLWSPAFQLPVEAQ